MLKKVTYGWISASNIAFSVMLALSLFVNESQAQSSANYSFSSGSSASLTDMSSGTTTLIGANFASQIGDYASTVASLGGLSPSFDFWFMGTRYYQFSVNSNGLLKFGGTAVSTAFTNSLATSTNIPFLAPFWDDMDHLLTGKVHYKVTGTFPNRILIVEWLDFLLVYSATAGSTSTFQVRLYENTGTIEYVYGAMNNATTTATTTASIGFTNSNANSGLASVTSISTPAVATTTAGVVNNLVNNTTDGAITGLNSAANGSRVIYSFSQAAPTAPTGLTFTGVTATSTTLNWTDTANNEVGYVIYTSTDNSTFTFNQQVGADIETATVTGLTGNTIYYYRVYAVREGALSTALTGNQLTATATTYTTAGSIVIPCGVTSITVEAWGAGGGGGSSNNTTAAGGSGGGGGAYAKGSHTVTPGSTYFYSPGTVGVGGPANSTTAPTAGGAAWFNAIAATNSAPGNSTDGTLGAGGSGGVNNSTATPNNNGAAASSYGNVSTTDGSDGVGGSASGGGAGGAASNPNGGAGGAGSTTTDGSPGTAPGGGGGGGNDVAANKGGNGGLGQIILTYINYIPNTAPTGASATTTSGCNSYSTTLTQTGGTLGTQATWYWYSGSCGGTLVGTSTSANASLTTTVSTTTTFYVRAEGGACASTTTCGSVLVTVLTAPSCATNLLPANGLTLRTSGTTYSWDAPAGATGYKIYFDQNATPVTLVSDQAGLTYATGALSIGTYYLRVVPYSACGDATSCSIRTISVTSAPNWKMDSTTASIVRTRGTASDAWQTNYSGGIATIPSTAYWILRKTSNADATYDPSISDEGAYYPNLTVENNAAGNWTTGAASKFTGAAGFPTILGDFDVGGAGTSTVTFLNDNTDVTLTLVNGDIVVRSGSTLQNYGTGFEVKGDLNVIGTHTYDATPSPGNKVKFSGTVAQNITGAGTINLYDMEVNKTAENVTVLSLATVNNVLTLVDGYIINNTSGNFKLAAAATVSPTATNKAGTAASFVSGYLTRDLNSTAEWPFPMGMASLNKWRPLSIKPNTDATLRTWTVQSIVEVPKTVYGTTITTGEALTDILNEYDFKIFEPAAVAVDLKLWYDTDLTGTDEDSSLIGHWNTGVSQWNNWTLNSAGSWVRDTAANWVKVLAISTFSPVVPGRRGGVLLPIRLLTFNAYAKEKVVMLNWATASETNNSYYSIERSDDGKNFSPLLKVDGKGNQNITNNYETIDYAPLMGISYYRLKQVDFNGKFSYSDIKPVKFLQRSEISVIPNPTNGKAEIHFYSDRGTEVAIRLSDSKGKIIFSKALKVQQEGMNKYSIDLSNFNTGMYFINVGMDGYYNSVKLIKN